MSSSASTFTNHLWQFTSACDRNESKYCKLLKLLIVMENSQPELPKIQIFQTIRKNFDSIGIESNQSRPFNTKIWLVSLTLGLGITCTLIFIVDETKTFFELTLSIYECSTLVAAAFAFLITIYYLDKLYIILNDWECIVNTSKYIVFCCSQTLQFRCHALVIQ